MHTQRCLLGPAALHRSKRWVYEKGNGSFSPSPHPISTGYLPLLFTLQVYFAACTDAKGHCPWAKPSRHQLQVSSSRHLPPSETSSFSSAPQSMSCTSLDPKRIDISGSFKSCFPALPANTFSPQSLTSSYRDGMVNAGLQTLSHLPKIIP